VVIPDDYVARYGADTFRLYMMFLGPYQEGGDFQDLSISGPRRFLEKLWSVVNASVEKRVKADGSWDLARRRLHQTIHQITTDMVELEYNTAISSLMKYLNGLRETAEQVGGGGGSVEQPVPVELLEPMLVLLSPLAPHFAEEAWERLGHKESIFDAKWPAHDESIAREDNVELVVQVNGKVRSRITVPRGLPEKEAVAKALADDAVKKFVNGSPLKKAIYVPDRLVNLVV